MFIAPLLLKANYELGLYRFGADESHPGDVAARPRQTDDGAVCCAS
jgi:hypothetical protein